MHRENLTDEYWLAMAEPPRSLVAIVAILGLMFIVRFGQRLIMRVMSTLAD
ncbi:hypothetical protein [Klebsiella quasipneumoniae]|uniref:hypothetical protein n=1 Tax=Klebsiella quasipneumoniae TaxID=1463165 RepID=UPI002201A515|nr:hypothetical protein [Klebsiella quasipneumoniae]BDO03741.1 hypothetical protein KAM622c_33280 [Klebsiella quasipneumoniae subsp. quasipneumoniae]